MKHISLFVVLSALLFIFTSCEQAATPLESNEDTDTTEIIYKQKDTITILDTLISMGMDIDTVYAVTVSGDTIYDDTFEPNDNYLAACTLSVGAIQSHLIHSASPDWFTFKVEAGTAYELAYASGRRNARGLTVYTANGVDYLAHSRNSRLGGVSLFYAHNAGYYLAEMEADKASSSYAIMLRKISPIELDMYEPDNYLGEAIQLIPGDPALSYTMNFRDTDWVAIDMDSGTCYEVVTTNVKTNDTRGAFFTLFDSDMKKQETNNFSNGYDSSFYVCQQTGTHYLAISGREDAIQGHYSIEVCETDPGASDIYEPDNSVEEATAISLGTFSESHTLTVGDRDFYSVSVDSGQYYDISMITDGVRMSATVIGDYYVPFYEYGDDNLIEYNYKFQAIRSGDLDFYVHNYKKKRVSYRLNIDTIDDGIEDSYEPDNTLETDKLHFLNIGDEPQEHSLTINDVDFYRIIEEEGMSYSVTLQLSGFEYCYLNRYDSDFTSVSFDRKYLTTNSVKVEWDAAKTDTTFLEVYGRNINFGDYTIELTEE